MLQIMGEDDYYNEESMTRKAVYDMMFVKFYFIVVETIHRSISKRFVSRDVGTRYKQGKKKASARANSNQDQIT